VPLSVIGQMLVSGILVGCIYGAVAMGFSLIFGVVRIVNFAHAGAVVWAMYVVFLVVSGGLAGPYVATAGAVSLFFVLGYLLQRLLMVRIVDMTEEMHIIFTFGLLLVLTYLAQFFFGPDVRYLPPSGKYLEFGGVVVQRELVIGGAISSLGALGLQLALARTWLGKAIRASADNRRGAVLTGLDVRHLTRVAMAVSVASAALAGGLLATFTTIYPLRALELAILAFLIVVLGGMRSPLGSFGAGVIVGVLDGAGTLLLSPSLAQVLIHGLIFAALLVRPQGLWGRKEIA
jgi:branched-chain amino acid transport system permease protein